MTTETERGQNIQDKGLSTPGATDATGASIPSQPSLPALSISGVVVNKADLISALSIYVPRLADVRTLDGDRFVLDFAPQSKER